MNCEECPWGRLNHDGNADEGNIEWTYAVIETEDGDNVVHIFPIIKLTGDVAREFIEYGYYGPLDGSIR